MVAVKRPATFAHSLQLLWRNLVFGRVVALTTEAVLGWLLFAALLLLLDRGPLLNYFVFKGTCRLLLLGDARRWCWSEKLWHRHCSCRNQLTWLRDWEPFQTSLVTGSLCVTLFRFAWLRWLWLTMTTHWFKLSEVLNLYVSTWIVWGLGVCFQCSRWVVRQASHVSWAAFGSSWRLAQLVSIYNILHWVLLSKHFWVLWLLLLLR